MNFDLIGVGAGPSNLSLAALLHRATHINSIFFEKQTNLTWHPGMLLPEAKLQVSFLKDLVTLVDPTNPYSFLNFLIEHQRIYQFITADFKQISRLEYCQYLKWVFNQINYIKKGEEAVRIDYDGHSLLLETNKGKYKTKNLVMGVGLVPYIPTIAESYVGENVFHSSSFLHNNPNYKGKRVAIIGGGQSGAEIMARIIAQDDAMPAEVYWFSKRVNFLPLDDSPFTNELFIPQYTQYFYNIDENTKKSLMNQHKLASDGISIYTAEAIYQRLYEIRFIRRIGGDVLLYPSHQLSNLSQHADGYEITLLDIENNHQAKTFKVDIIILCTGYQYQQPNFLSGIKQLLHYKNNKLLINSDYQVQWDGMQNAAIYIQNGAAHTHGIADLNLSLIAYRSAGIINKVAGTQVYPNINGTEIINWTKEQKMYA